jgi:lysophospholipase L1-like esterase
MARAWWTVAAVYFSALAGYAGWVQAPVVQWWLSAGLLPGVQVPAGQESVFAVAVAGTVAVLCLFALGFLVPAAEDARLTATVLGRLRRAGAEQPPWTLPPDEFRRAFANSHMAAAAAEYADALFVEEGRAAGGAAAYRAGLAPSACFSAARLIEEPLHVRFFQYLPPVLWALGTVVFALGMLKGLATLQSAAVAEAVPGQAQFLGEVQGGLLAAIVPVAVAPLIGVALRVVLALRGRQLARLWEQVGALYPAAPSAAERPETRYALRAGAAAYALGIKAAIADLRRELVASHDRLNKTMAQQAKDIGSTIAREVGGAGAALVAQLADVSRSVMQEQNAQAKEILERSVSVFLAELERNYGNQLKDAHQILSSCMALATDIRKEFAQMAASFEKRAPAEAEGLVVELRKALDAQTEAQARRSAELVAQMEQAVARLSQEMIQQSRTLAEPVNRLVAGVETLAASPLAVSGAEMAKMTAAFDDLRAALADLRTSLVPVLKEVAAGIEAGARESGRIAALASELNAAIQAARGMAEKLQERVRESEARRVPVAPPGVRPAVPDNLGRQLSEALRALREETQSSAKEPPKP